MCMYGNYKLPEPGFAQFIFENKHFVPSLKHLETIKSRDIVDVGGWIGDTALIFSEFTDKKVYVYEPSKNNFEKMKKTISMNKKTNIFPINLALGETTGYQELFDDGPSTSTNGAGNNVFISEFSTLDEEAYKKNMDIGLIKVDIEGNEQNFLKGAINTIKKFTPTMMISIYHSAYDFFYIKKFIEDLDLGYSFTIKKPIDGQILLETNLICEPHI